MVSSVGPSESLRIPSGRLTETVNGLLGGSFRKTQDPHIPKGNLRFSEDPLRRPLLVAVSLPDGIRKLSGAALRRPLMVSVHLLQGILKLSKGSVRRPL